MICTICDTPIADGQRFRRHARPDTGGGARQLAYTHAACREAPTVVPFIAQWTGETVTQPPVTLPRFGGVGYADETAADRDERGVLWQRRPTVQGAGRPMYGKIHPGRQRLAMSELPCQVCGGLADRDDRGVLWLLEDDRADYPGWPDELMTTHPPTCRGCIRRARRQCPHMWAGSVAVRVGMSEACAVYGRRYTLSPRGPVPLAVEIVPFESPLLRFTVAGQLIRALYHCVIVSLDEELAAY